MKKAIRELLKSELEMLEMLASLDDEGGPTVIREALRHEINAAIGMKVTNYLDDIEGEDSTDIDG